MLSITKYAQLVYSRFPSVKRPTPLAMEIIHFGISCPSTEKLEESIAFYRTHFGAQIARDKPAEAEEMRKLFGVDSSARVVQLKFAENMLVELMCFDNADVPPGVNHIALRRPDAEAIFAGIASAGYRTVSIPKSYGPYQLVIDPCGVKLELKRPLAQPQRSLLTRILDALCHI